MSRYALVAGGGTAGHVSPGLAVANALVDRGHPRADILYVGSDRGIERELVPAAGFDLVTVSGRGVPRRLSMAAVRAVLAIAVGVFEAGRVVVRERPRVVLALGGFASVPVAVVAWLLRIPIVVHEQNAVPGAANRLVGRWARVCAVSYPGTDLPRAVLTGNPVRPEMLAVSRADRTELRTALDVPADSTMVVVTGGSLGARRINEAIAEVTRLLAHRSDLVIHHVIGERDWETISAATRDLDAVLDYRPVRYEHDMPSVLAAADVVISRAGASITAEIAAMGLPSILIPLPGAPGDHQTKNARALVDVGAAVLVHDRDCSGPRIAEELDRLLGRSDKLAAMGERAARLGRRDSAHAVADLLEEHAR